MVESLRIVFEKFFSFSSMSISSQDAWPIPMRSLYTSVVVMKRINKDPPPAGNASSSNALKISTRR